MSVMFALVFKIFKQLLPFLLSSVNMADFLVCALWRSKRSHEWDVALRGD